MGFLLFIAVYAYYAYTLQVIAQKTNTKDSWWAWVPIANAFLMLRIAKKPAWWILLFLVPLLNVVIMVVVWWKIAETRNKPGWLGILMIIPMLNLIPPGLMAFTDD